jgi:mannitol-1-phosphate 5-dehydrogenase
MPPADGLASLTAQSAVAYLVDPFNKIMTGCPHFAQIESTFTSGFPTFVGKEDLTPFDDAKFLGHNGIHALGAYLGMAAGMNFVCEWAETPGMMAFIRAAFVDEVGAGLVHRYAGTDALFTPAGFAAFADALLVRTVNPFLRDTIERLGRDPERKLGWDDRLIGAMRITHAAGITPWRFAMGAAAALAVLDADAEPESLLPALWQPAAPPKEEEAIMLALVREGKRRFDRWRQMGFPDLRKE